MYICIVEHIYKIKLLKKFYIKQTFFGFFRKFSRSGVDVDGHEVYLTNTWMKMKIFFTSLRCVYVFVYILDRLLRLKINIFYFNLSALEWGGRLLAQCICGIWFYNKCNYENLDIKLCLKFQIFFSSNLWIFICSKVYWIN